MTGTLQDIKNLYIEVIEKDKIIIQGRMIKITKDQFTDNKKSISEIEIMTNEDKIVKIMLNKGIRLKIGGNLK